MPPLMLTTAKELLNEELKKEDSARVPIAAE